MSPKLSPKLVLAALLVSTFGASLASAVEVVTVRSGQVGGLPGLAGQADDIVTVLNNNPPGGAISPSPFTAADFNGAITGAPAHVINPYTPFWCAGISDAAARWINFDGSFQNPDGSPGPGYGSPGSALYAIPFNVTTVGITSANITIEYAVDDGLGDLAWGGGNPIGMFVNGASSGYNGAGGNYAAPFTHSQSITGLVNTGSNYLFLYQRDAGVLVSGIIFSATITIIPAPGAAALIGMAGMVAVRRRR